nr:clp protease proteolytic subunit [Limonium aureum]
MPLGVPKVPFLLPESEDSEDKDSNWVDLNRLYRAGFLFLCNKIEPEVTNNLTNLLVYLGIEDPTRDLYLFINSTGGGIVPGMSIFDTMQEVRPDVYTVCIGKAYSMASFILAGGKLTKRLAFPHAFNLCLIM